VLLAAIPRPQALGASVAPGPNRRGRLTVAALSPAPGKPLGARDAAATTIKLVGKRFWRDARGLLCLDAQMSPNQQFKHVSLIEPVLLGVVQGATEFLPISSSAHLRIAGEFLPSARDPGSAFTAITQIGTEVAVLVYFRRDLVRIVTQWARSLRGDVRRNDPDAQMGWQIIIGTIPIGLAGYFAQHHIRSAFRSLRLTALVLIAFGVALGLADRIGKGTRELDDFGYGDGLLCGLAQALALIPGVSRSGATTTMGLALGFSRSAAAEYAFLLAVPAVFASGLYELRNSLRKSGPYGLKKTALATCVSFGVGFGFISLLMRFISKHSFLPFALYRILLGGKLLLLLSKGILRSH
jgi:undecaprenyl-diphosphatase